jgi:hypothetical protein
MTMPQDREAVAAEIAEQRARDEEATAAQETPVVAEASASADEVAETAPAAESVPPAPPA